MEEVRQVVGVVFGFGCCVMMEANFRFVVVCVVLWVPMGLVFGGVPLVSKWLGKQVNFKKLLHAQGVSRGLSFIANNFIKIEETTT